MAIDIEAPGGDEAALKAALQNLMVPAALDISYTGTWGAPYVFTLPGPSGVMVGADGDLVVASGVLITKFDLASESGLTTLSFNNLNGITGNFSPSGLDGLTALSLPECTIVVGLFNPSDMEMLTTFDCSALVTVGGDFTPNSMIALTDFDISALALVGGNFAPSAMPELVTLDVSALATVNGIFNPNDLPALTSLDCSGLVTVDGNFQPNNMDLVTTLTLSALTTVGGNFQPNNMNALTSITLPAIVSLDGNITINNQTAALTTFTLGATLKSVGDDVELSSCALAEASVDNILVRLAALDGTNGTTTYDNHSVTITDTSAPPGAAGLAAKTTLEGRGNTVTVNV